MVVFFTVLALAILFFVYGFLTAKYRIFPYGVMKFLNSAVSIMLKTSAISQFNEKTDVVMVGDAITYYTDWSEEVKNIENMAISGDSAVRVLARINDILTLKPKRAFLMFGINDLDRGMSPEQTIVVFEEIVTKLQDNGVRVYLQSTLETNKTLRGCYIFEKIRQLNVRLRELARQQEICYIDLNDSLSNTDDGLIKKYSTDGIHLTEAGYIAWKNVLKPYFSKEI